MQKLKLEWHQTVKKGSDVLGLGWVLLKTVEIIRFCCLCSLHHIYKSFHCSKLEKIVTRNHFQDNFSLVLCDLKLFTVGGGVPGQAMPHHNILNITRWSWHRGEAAHLSPSLVTLVTTSPSPCVCHTGTVCCPTLHSMKISITTTTCPYKNVIVLLPMNGSVISNQTGNNHPVTFTNMTSADADSFHCWQEFC